MIDSSRGSAFTQGDVLPGDLALRLQTDGHLPAGWDVESGWVILVSHPCDLASADYEAEPVAEVLLAVPAATQANGNWLWGKSPRRLHLELPGDHTTVLDVNVHNRSTIPRELLIGEAPDAERQLPDAYPSLLARWLSQRYRRDALPNKFNERTRSIVPRMRQALKKPGGGLLEGLYILLHTEDELPADLPYRIALRGTMRVEDHENDDRRHVAVSMMDGLATTLGQVEGIQLEDWEVVALSEMSLDDIRYYKRWDYDDLSHRSSSTSQPASP